MSIVAVHGPQTFGSKAVRNSNNSFQAFAITGDGLKWRFVPTDQSQVAANYDWAWANGTGTTGGSPASPLLNTMIPEFTFPVGPATKTITLTLNAVAQPTLTITIPGPGGDPIPDDGDAPEEGGEEVPPEEQVTEEIPTETEAYDPGDYTVAEVQQYVEANPDELEAVYEAEVAGKNRTTLVAWLEEQFPFDPGDYNVQEVVDYASANPDQLEDIIAAEQAGKNRTTLVSQLEGMRS